MKIIETQAGDDSEGKMWGLEENNLLIIVGGFVLGITLTTWMFNQGQSPIASIGYGVTPSILGIAYVFTLREGRPKHFDLDLLETFLRGKSWQQTRARLNNTPTIIGILVGSTGVLAAGGAHYQFLYADKERQTKKEEATP